MSQAAVTPQQQPPRQPSREQLAQVVMGSLQGEIEPVAVPFTYHLGIFFVALVMILLPLVYIGIILLVAYGIYYHVVYDVGMLGAARGRGAVAMFMMYLTPVVCGGILLVFMVKPLLSRPSRQMRPRSLRREDEPLLFAFVDRICDIVGAPQPVRIDVDCEVNASASFRRGIWSMLGDDLVLTIGAPLVAGLNLRQLAGVLAHEFGHFAQGAGMRMTYIARSINHWFVRVVYERDSWDDNLIKWSESIDLRVGWILYIARLFIWITRKVLWVLMYVGHIVSCFMLRQMEFDADRYEARLAGSDTFESTARQLVVLNVAQHGAQDDLGTFYDEGRLADNLPKLIIHNISQFRKDARQKLRKITDEQTTGLFDTHPADKDRIASAYSESAPGIFRLDFPASMLFTDFDRIARSVTWDFYEAIFERELQPGDVHPVDELIARAGADRVAFEALGRCWQGAFNPLRPLKMPAWEIHTTPDPQQTLNLLKQYRQQIVAHSVQYNNWFRTYDEIDGHLVEAEQASAVLQVGGSVPSDAFSHPFTSLHRVGEFRGESRQRQATLGSQMEPYELLLGRRLYASLQLLWVSQVAQRVEHAATWQRHIPQLMRALEHVEREFPQLLEIRNQQAGMAVLLNALPGNEENVTLISALRGKMNETLGRLRGLQSTLDPLPYPFDHAEGNITVGRFAVKELPSSENWGGIYDAGADAPTKLYRLSARLLGRLCQAAEAVETALGLPALPEPKEDNADLDETGEAA